MTPNDIVGWPRSVQSVVPVVPAAVDIGSWPAVLLSWGNTPTHTRSALARLDCTCDAPQTPALNITNYLLGAPLAKISVRASVSSHLCSPPPQLLSPVLSPQHPVLFVAVVSWGAPRLSPSGPWGNASPTRLLGKSSDGGLLQPEAERFLRTFYTRSTT